METLTHQSPLTFLEGEFKHLTDPDSGHPQLFVLVEGHSPTSVDTELQRWEGREVALVLHFLDQGVSRPGQGSCLYPAKCLLHDGNPQRMIAASLQGTLERWVSRWVVKTASESHNVPLQYMPGHLARLTVIPSFTDRSDPLDGKSLDALEEGLKSLWGKNGR